RGLTGRLIAEAEREGTAHAEPLTTTAEAFARDAHGQGGRALGAATEWQARREAFAAGRVDDARNGGSRMDPRVEHGHDGGGEKVGASSPTPGKVPVPGSAAASPATASGSEPPGVF